MYVGATLAEHDVTDVVLLQDHPRAPAIGVLQRPQRVPQRLGPEGRQIPSSLYPVHRVRLHPTVATHSEHPAGRDWPHGRRYEDVATLVVLS